MDIDSDYYKVACSLADGTIVVDGIRVEQGVGEEIEIPDDLWPLRVGDLHFGGFKSPLEAITFWNYRLKNFWGTCASPLHSRVLLRIRPSEGEDVLEIKPTGAFNRHTEHTFYTAKKGSIVEVIRGDDALDLLTGEITLKDGKYTFHKGKCQSVGDNPAIIYKTGAKVWLDENCRVHRDGGLPAEVGVLSKRWFRGGNLFREAGPAVVTPFGEKWVDNLERSHRIGGPAWTTPEFVLYSKHGTPIRDFEEEGVGPAIEYSDGSQVWSNFRGELSRPGDFPAIVSPHMSVWAFAGRLNRGDDNPTVVIGGVSMWLEGPVSLPRDDTIEEYVQMLRDGFCGAIYTNDKFVLKREGGGPVVEYSDGRPPLYPQDLA